MTSLMRSAESYLNSENTLSAAVLPSVHQPSDDAIHGVLHLVEPYHAERHTLQQFIASGFARHYQANVWPQVEKLVADQTGNAAAAESMAARVSATFASATCPVTTPVAGL